MTTPDAKNETSKLWSPFLNFAALPPAGYYFGSEVIGKLRDYSVFQWLPPASLTPMDFAVGGAINAAALSGMEYLSGRAGADVDFNKAVIITLTLAATIFAAPHITKATSQWTGVILTTDQMISIAVVNCGIKTTLVAAVAFLKHLQDSSIPSIPTSNEDARKLSQYQAAYLYDLFKEDPDKWNERPLAVRVILNMRFKENGSDQQLSLKGFKSNVGEEMQKDELQFLFDQAKGSTEFSDTERKHMNSLFYAGGLYNGVRVSETTMPDQVSKDLKGYKPTDFATLPEATMQWICFYLTVFPSKSFALEKEAALSDRMIELKMHSPQLEFAPSKKPTAPTDISNPADDEKYLLGWFYGYFKQNETEFTALPLNERISWSKAFLNELDILISLRLSEDEAKGLDTKQVVFFMKYFNEYGNESGTYWATLPVAVQKALNAKFDDLTFTTRRIYPQTEADVKSMTEEDLRALHSVFEADAVYVTHLTDNAAKKEMISRLYKLGLKMPFAPAPEPTFTDRAFAKLTPKNVAITAALLVGAPLACYSLGPPLIAALGNMFKGEDCPRDITLLHGQNFTLSANDTAHVALPDGKVFDIQANKTVSLDSGEQMVFESGQLYSLPKADTLCVGTADTPCMTKLSLGNETHPFLVWKEPFTTKEPAIVTATLTPQATITLEDNHNVNVAHGDANVTVSIGQTIGNHTFAKNDILSFNDEGHFCVGTSEAPCEKTFTSQGESLVLYTPPKEPTIVTATLTPQATITLEDNHNVNVVHGDANVTVSIGQTIGNHTFAKNDILSFNDEGHFCVGTSEAPCEKTFTSQGESLVLYSPPEEPVTLTAILTNQDSVTLADNLSVTVKHADGNVTVSVGETHAGHTFESGQVLSFNQEGNVCVGTSEAPCEKTFTFDGATLTPYIAPVATRKTGSAPKPVKGANKKDIDSSSAPVDVKKKRRNPQ